MKNKRFLAALMSLAMLFSLIVLPTAAAFQDTEGSWAKAAIERWSEAGVVVGDENGQFRPDANMTRAEFAVILDRVMRYQSTATNPFNDVPSDSWYTSAVLKAYAAGVISGTSSTTMSPSANITREQAMVLLGRALGIAENTSAVSSFSDASSISSYATGFVGGMAAAGYIQGSNGMVNPTSNVTRAEVVTILNNVIGTWAATSGETVSGNATGITVVAAPGVTLSGSVGKLLVTPGAAGGSLTLKDAKVSGEMTINAASVKLNLDGNTAVSKLVLPSKASNSSVTLGKDATIQTLESHADSLSVSGSGKISTMKVNDGSGVKVAAEVQVSDLQNNSSSDVTYGSKVIKPSGSTEPTKPTTPSGGGSSGGSSSGGNNNNDSTVTTDNIKTADELKKAAEKNAKTVTAKLHATDCAILPTEAISITNNTVENLTIDVQGVTLGDVTVYASKASSITLTGSGSFASLTVKAPEASVTNTVEVKGKLTIEGVKNDSFHQKANVGSIVMAGKGKLDLANISGNPDITVTTSEQVKLTGKVNAVTVTAKNANLTLSDLTIAAPAISSQVEGTKVTVSTDKAVSLRGNLSDVTLNTANATVQLTSGATVAKMTAAASNVAVSGSGSVTTLDAQADVTIGVPVETVTVTKTAILSAADNSNASIGEVVATAPVTLNTSVEKVSVPAGASNISINVAPNKTVQVVDTKSNVEIKGSGTVRTVDVTDNAVNKVTVGSDSTVSAVTTTGDPSAVTVTVTGGSTIAVEKKAAAPTGVTFTAPTGTKDGKDMGKIAATSYTNLQYSSDKATWTDLTQETAVYAGLTYYVRTKANGDCTIPSEPVSAFLPKAIGVSSASISGAAIVGQTLTASANGDATGTLTYQWFVGTEKSGTGNTLLLTETMVGKTVKVEISNYGETPTYASISTVRADTSALQKAISQAEVVMVGVTESDKGKAEVLLGVAFVPVAIMKDISDAKVEAKNVWNDGTSTQATVNAATSKLNDAITAFVAAKQEGTKDSMTELQNALKDAVKASHVITLGVKRSANGFDVPPSSTWTTPLAWDNLNAAIGEAEQMIASTNTSDLSKALQTLNGEQVAFKASLQYGATIDNSKLQAAIRAAESNLKTAVVAIASTEVAPNQLWVIADDKTAYEAAIEAAQEATLANTTQADMNTALALLTAATDAFDHAKKPGTKDMIAPIVGKISATRTAADKAAVSFTSNEDGQYRYLVVETSKAPDFTEDSVFSGEVKAGEAFSFDAIIQDGSKASAYDLYIQVKDAGGNISQNKAVIPADSTPTVDPTDVIAATLHDTTTPDGIADADLYKAGSYQVTLNNGTGTGGNGIAVNVAIEDLKEHQASAEAGKGHWVGIGVPFADAKVIQGFGSAPTEEPAPEAWKDPDSSMTVDGKTYSTVYFNAAKANGQTGFLRVKVGETVYKYQLDFSGVKFYEEQSDAVAEVTKADGETILCDTLYDALSVEGVKTIKLLQSVESTVPVSLQAGTTLDGNGKSVTTTAAAVNGPEDQAIIIYGADVTVKNITVTSANDYAIHAYNTTNVTLENVTATSAVKGAILINASTVTMKGTNTLNGIWGGIEVGKGKDLVIDRDPSLTIEGAAVLQWASSVDAKAQPLLWVDQTNFTSTEASAVIGASADWTIVNRLDKQQISYYSANPLMSISEIPAVTKGSLQTSNDNGYLGTDEATTADLPKMTASLNTPSDFNYSGKVRLHLNLETDNAENLQVIAKDSLGGYWNIVKSGWGPADGFALPNSYSEATDCYLLANAAGTYSGKLQLKDLNDNLICELPISFTVTEAQGN